MKKLCVIALFAVFTVPAYPQGSVQAADSYGAKVNIISEYDYSSVDRSYLNVANTQDMRHPHFNLYSLVWHPDGKHIIYTDSSNIYSVSKDGGIPRVLFESFYIYPYKDIRVIFDEYIQRLIGISPDGKVYFTRGLIDSSLITVIVGAGNQVMGGSIQGAKTVVDCLDTSTGKVQTVLRDFYSCVLSPSGKFLAYLDYNQKKILLMDMNSGVTKTTGSYKNCAGLCFSADESSILYSEDVGNGSYQIFRIPVQGGNPQQLTFYSGGSTGLIRTELKSMPDGEWILYFDDNNQVDSVFKAKIMQPSAFNIRTGEVVSILPPTVPISYYNGLAISPDGKDICFALANFAENNYMMNISMYIKEISLTASTHGTTAVANTPVFSFGLGGNYPNPFNPSTTIEFTLASPGKASLAVYDLLGRKVRGLVSGQMAAGSHSVVWNGRDENGKAVSSGIYLSCLTQAGKSVSRRMLLLK
jgi:Tol biopolymer transport system component